MTSTFFRRVLFLRRVLAALCVTAGLLAAAASSASPARADDWVVRGSGFGHGVGMSQYGAKAMADAGRTAPQILAHYYRGTTYDKVADTATIRVNVRHRVSSTAIVGQALTAGGGTIRVAAGGRTLSAPAGRTVTVVRSGSGVVARCGSGCSRTSVSGPSAVVTFTHGASTVSTDGKRYGVGSLGILPSPGTTGLLEVVVRARMHDEYLDGIKEMPWSWPSAALQTQAAAARSYALRKVAAGVRPSCGCHVFDSVSDQVFGTYPTATERAYLPRWRAAVRAAGSSTTGYVPRYDGRVIEAYYSSSNGGWSQENEDVWGGSPVPYLRSARDPWSTRAENPRRSWRTTIPRRSLASAFGLRDIARLDLSRRTTGHGVDVAVATSSSGATASMDGEDLRRRFGLSGTWLRHPAVRTRTSGRVDASLVLARRTSVRASTAVLTGSADADLVDVLAARPFASAVAGPQLMTGATRLPSGTLAELDRRKGYLRTVYVIGSTRSVSDGVVSALKARGLRVYRVGGTDPYARTARVAELVDARRDVPSVVVATRTTLGASVPFSPVATVRYQPFLLVPPSSLPTRTSAALGRIDPASAHVVGSSSLVTTGVTGPLQRRGIYVRRFSGDRYSVGRQVATAFAGSLGRSEVVLAPGKDDRVAEAALAGAYRRPLVLTSGATVPTHSLRLLQSDPSLERIRVFGGTTAVPASAATRAAES